MSKLSQLHAELSEQASKLGFEDLGEAEQAGYGVDWENAMLIKMDDEQDEAHKAWLKEKQKVIRKLQLAKSTMMANNYFECADRVAEAINFIKKGEM